jgi:hypothetical protein
VIVLASVEVHVAEVVFPTSPYHRAPEPHGEAGFEVDALALKGDVCDEKLRLPNLWSAPQLS